jgi:enoyl-CoA hydratase/carnithine racemase
VDDGTVALERRDGAALITVNRPESRNALTAAMKHRLLGICAELNADRSVRVVIVRGAAGAFISGGDLREMGELASVSDLIKLAHTGEELYAAVEGLNAPTVAVIEGGAFGSGLVIALSCDLRICTTDATFGVPSARAIGNCLSPDEYRRLVSVLGIARAKEMLLAARILSAEVAAEWGLVTAVHDRGELEEGVRALTDRLASHAPLAMWAAKESLRRLARGEQARDDILERVLASDDFREGLAAFTEKRRPRWTNQ